MPLQEHVFWSAWQAARAAADCWLWEAPGVDGSNLIVSAGHELGRIDRVGTQNTQPDYGRHLHLIVGFRGTSGSPITYSQRKGGRTSAAPLHRLAFRVITRACTIQAGTPCPQGTARVQMTPPGRRTPPGKAPTTSPWRSSGPWGTRRTTSCPRTTRTSLAGTWSPRTSPPCRTCSRWGRASGPSSWCQGNRRATGTRWGQATWAGTCSRKGNQSERMRLRGSRSLPGKA